MRTKLIELLKTLGEIALLCFSAAVVLTIISSLGCSTAPIPPLAKMEKGKKYRFDMIINVAANGVDYAFDGVGVLPQSNTYDFHIQTVSGQLDMFILRSCSRSVEKSKNFQVVIKKPRFIFKDKKITLKNQTKFTYAPTELENTRGCPVEMEGVHIGGQHSFGFVEFERPEYKLPATLSCNTLQQEYNGISVCQGYEKTIQRISFENPVNPVQDAEKCGFTKKGQKSYDFDMISGKCTATFYETVEPFRMHRLVLIGYDAYLYRE